MVTMPEQTPIRPTDDAARKLARSLLDDARFGALAVIDPATGAPYVSRIAVGLTPEGEPMSLISELARHTQALRQSPTCSLLLGEPGTKGDPLSHPRITLLAKAAFVPRDTPRHAELASHYLTTHPKSKFYLGFADFSFIRFHLTGAHLNGGFGNSFHLTAQDLMSCQRHPD